LERRVGDLVATAQQELSSRGPEAALEAYRTALGAIDDALALDPSNPTAGLLRPRVMEAMGRLQQPSVAAASTPAPAALTAAPAAPIPARAGADRLPEPPSFQLLKEGDVPLFESGQDLIATPRGGYLKPPEAISIFDTTPRPEEPDYLRVIAVVVAVVLAIVLVRVVWYYATYRVDLNANPLQQVQSAPPPAQPAPSTSATNSDDGVLYYAEPNVTLPSVLSRYQPRGDSPETIKVFVTIDGTGTPVNPRIWGDPHPGLDTRAVQAALRWRFRPATKDGMPAAVGAQIDIVFHQ